MCVTYIVQLILLLLSNQILVSTRNYSYDICKSSSQRIYLELGENGTLTASNLMVHSKNQKHACHMEIITCPSCAIFVNFNYINLTDDCNDMKNELNCEYIYTFEHSYEELSKRRFYGNKENMGITTMTKHLIIQLFYFNNNDLAFIANYKSIRNQIHLSENKFDKNESYLISPFFPSYYANDLASEYIIKCAESENCRVRIIFIDFQLSSESLMEFIDYNGQRLDVVTGVHFRPPVLISSGPSLTMRFYANGGTGLGFKAKYFFEKNSHNITEIITDCGGYVDNLGSAITMMNMVKSGIKFFYCFWIIKPPKNYLHFKTYLYLKIANFRNMQDQTQIVVHESTTSAGKILEVLHDNGNSSKEHIQPIETGFYVTLNGSFNTKSRLAIVYTAFSYKADFLCKNHRCIPRYLTCDGFDHCGDNSDEPISCFKDTNPEPSHTWYSGTPNYYFPKIDQYADLKTATFIVIICTLGLISLVSTMFILLYRINNRTRHERELENHLQIITDLLEEEILDTESITDEPPLYEAPPDYEEVVKISQKDSNKSSRHKRRKRRSKSVKLKKNDIPPEQLLQSTNHNLDLPVANENKFKRHFRRNNPFFYFSDKAISYNVKLILRRKWHSHGEINIKRDFEVSARMKISQEFFSESSKLCYREIASDSELLNIDSDDDKYQNSLYKSNANETVSEQDDQRLFDHKKNTTCQCEGACACVGTQNIPKKLTRKFHKKLSKDKYSKFYTR